MKRVTRILCLGLCVSAVASCGGAQERKARYLELGKALYEQGNYDKAQIELKNAIQIDPKDAEARYLLGRSLEQKQGYQAAVGNYQAVLNEHPDHLAARIRLGRLYLLGGAPDRAMEMVDVAMKQNADHADVLALRGGVRAAQGDMKGALADSEAALARDTMHADAIALLVGLYNRQRQSDKAIALLERVVTAHPKNAGMHALLAEVYAGQNRVDDAAAQLQKIIQLDPDKLGHRARLAGFYAGHNQLDNAERVLREAVAHAAKVTEPKLALLAFLDEKRGREIARKELLGFIAADPKEYVLRLDLARRHAGDGQVDQAKQVYTEVIKEDGTGRYGLEAHNRLAALLAQEGKLAEAAAQVAEVLKENPGDADGLTLRGKIALTRGQLAGAIADFRTVLKDQPNAAEVTRLLATAHVKNGEAKLAFDLLHNAVEREPRDLDARLILGHMLAQNGDVSGAIRQFNAVLAIEPKHAAALEALFRAHMVKADYAAAQTLLQRMRQAYPDSGAVAYLSGLWNQAQKRYTASIADFEAALKKAPNDIDLLTALVTSHVAANQAERALARVKQALVVAPENAALHNLAGEVLLVQKKYPEAVESFRGAIGRAPILPMGYTNLAIAYTGMQAPDQAEAAYLNGIKATNGAPVLLAEFAAYYQRQNKHDAAMAQYDALLAKVPESQFAANNLAMLLALHRDDAESLKKAGELADRLRNASDPAYLDTLGWVRYRRGDFDGAIVALEQALKQAPKEPLIRYHLGMAHYKKGNAASAREQLQEALDTKVNFRGRDDAQATLQKLRQS